MTDNITTEDTVKEFKLDTELHTNPNYNQLKNTEGKLASLKVGKPDNETTELEAVEMVAQEWEKIEGY